MVEIASVASFPVLHPLSAASCDRKVQIFHLLKVVVVMRYVGASITHCSHRVPNEVLPGRPGGRWYIIE
jgi:hypothetical protein